MANYQFKPADRMSTNKMHPVSRDYPVMPRRVLGESGLKVGQIGLGTAALGRKGMNAIPDDEAIFIIEQALDMEACLVDTAPTYGDGRAESLLGQVARRRRSQVVVSTKAGYFSDGHSDFSGPAIRLSLETSLKRMGLGFVDLLMLHNPPADALTQAHPAFVELEKLKQEGKIRAYGASVSGSAQIKAVIEKTSSQVVEFIYNVFNQEAAAAFDLALQKRVGLVVCQPLDSGFLTGRFDAASFFQDDRRRFSRAEISRRIKLERQVEPLLSAVPTVNEFQSAIQFALAHPAVSSVVPGASTWQQVIGNVTACQRSLDPETVKALRAFWEKELKAVPLAL